MSVKFVQIETTTVCNQRCVFCPVSTDKRAKQSMTRETLQKLLADLAEFPVETVFINGFNEPTFDKNLPEWVDLIHAHGYRVHLNSNGSGLTPALADRLLAAGVAEININISTVDADIYRATRGNDDLGRVLPNLDHLLGRLAAEPALTTKLTLMVLGRLDVAHQTAIAGIEARFAAYPGAFTIIISPIDNYAGAADEYFPKDIHIEQLRGCLGKRTSEWLHFTPDGGAILCCQDYYPHYVGGNVNEQSAGAIFRGEQFAQWRRWTDGEEEAPADYICRQCVMAVDLKQRFCSRCTLAVAFGDERACRRCAVGG